MHNMQNICKKYEEYMQNMQKKYAEYARICKTYAKNMQMHNICTICKKCAKNVQEICKYMQKRYAKKMYRICKNMKCKYAKTRNIYAKYICQNMQNMQK